MSDIGKQALKTKINSKVYENSSQAITGAAMNEVLQDMVDTLCDGANLDAGSVTDSRLQNPVSVSQNISTGKEELSIGGEVKWILDNEPEAGSDNLVKSGGVYNFERDGINVATSYGWTDFSNIKIPARKLFVLKCIKGHLIDFSAINAGGSAKTIYNTSGQAIHTPSLNVGESLVFYATEELASVKARFDGSGSAFVGYNESPYNELLKVEENVDEYEQETNNSFDVINSSINNYGKLRGNSWIYLDYNMNAGTIYMLKNTGSLPITSFGAYDSNGGTVTVSGFTTISSGQTCELVSSANAVKIRIYCDGPGAATIEEKTTIIEKVDKITPIVYNNKSIIKGYKIYNGVGWPNYIQLSDTLLPGVKYIIKNEGAATIAIIQGKTVEYGIVSAVTITSSLAAGSSVEFTPNATVTHLRFDLGKISIEIKDIDVSNAIIRGENNDGYIDKDCTRNIIIVSKEVNANYYQSLADAYAAIQDSAYNNQYEVVVLPGKYQELNLVPPPYTHTHGMSPDSVIISSEGVNPGSSLPVFELENSVKISNLTIESHNGYCIHSSNLLGGKGLLFQNVVFDKEEAQSNQWYVIGLHTSFLGQKLEFQNCIFKSKTFGNVGIHTSASTTSYNISTNAHFVFNSCNFVNCSPNIGSTGGNGNNVFEINGCKYPIGQKGLGNWYTNLRTITIPSFYRYKRNEWQIIGGGNENLSMWQLQDGKTIRLVADYPITISGSAAPIIFGYNPYVNNVKTARLDCTLTSEYYIDDSQAGTQDVYQLWKRLGDCSSENKTLTVTVNNVSKTYTFTEDYLTSKTAQATIIAAMQAVLDNVTIEAITDSGYGYDNVNTSDILFIKVTAADIIKGEFITRTGAKATSATDIEDIVGVACEDKPINEHVKVWTSAFRFDTDYADGEYGLDANGALDANAVDKIGFVNGYNFYLY